MNPTPNDVMENPLWWVVAAAGAVLVAWGKRMNPWPVLQRVAMSLNAPLYTRLDRMEGKLDKACRVIDHMEGAEKAHAAVKAEDEARRERWE